MSSACPEGFKLIEEGLAKICIPDPELYRRSDGVFEPAWAPVFYNPAMITNRDITIVALRALGRSISLAVDSMASTGVRSIRMLLECPEVKHVIANDIDEDCVKIIEINAQLNNVSDRMEIHRLDCNELLYKLTRERRRADYVDIDPFGSPAPFLLAAFNAVMRRGVVGVTATDLAPLEGKYPRKLYRRYGIKGTKVLVSKSIAIRNLLAYMAKEAAKIDRVVKPLLAYWYRHYIRVYVEVDSGGLRASEALERCIGTIAYCNYCGYGRIVAEEDEAHIEELLRCPICGRQMAVIRDTWICRINDSEFTYQCFKEAEQCTSITLESKRIVLSVMCSSKVGDPLPIKISAIAKFLRRNMPKISTVIEKLNEIGYNAYRVLGTHDEIVTNAPYEEVLNIVRKI